jgi:hypothetical protein
MQSSVELKVESPVGQRGSDRRKPVRAQAAQVAGEGTGESWKRKRPPEGEAKARFTQEGADGASRRSNQAGVEPSGTGRGEGSTLNECRPTSEGGDRQTAR